MKRALLTLMAGIAVAVLAGCSSQCGHLLGAHRGTCRSAPETCAACDDCCDPNCRDGCLARHRAERAAYRGAVAGPLTGAVAYPYYTVRGPRDFLARNPSSIGP